MIQDLMRQNVYHESGCQKGQFVLFHHETEFPGSDGAPYLDGLYNENIVQQSLLQANVLLLSL